MIVFMVGALTTENGKKIYLYRANTENGDLSATQYLPTTQMVIGVDGIAPAYGSNSLTFKCPIGTVTVCDDGSNTMTGSDSNSTDNTTTYKEGGGASDNTSQNLITNGTFDPSKAWTIADLTISGTAIDITKRVGFWIYLKDEDTIDKINLFYITLGNDYSNYYTKIFLNREDNLNVGWNFFTSDDVVGDWSTTGSPTGTIKTFSLVFLPTSSISGNPIAEGDMIYDLLMQWDSTDEVKDMIPGYPTFDYNSMTVTKAFLLTTSEANGFFVDNFATINEDSTPLIGQISLSEGDSKSSTDQWRITFKERLI